MQEYDDLEGLNWSSLKHIHTSPMLFEYRREHPEPRKPAYTIGGAIHTLSFEPDRYHERYGVFDGTRRGKAWDAWQAKNEGVESLKPHEDEACRRAAMAVRAHPVAAAVLENCRVEEPCTWTDPVSGIACKGRFDAISSQRVIDLKTTTDASPRGFGKQAGSLLYHGQMAWYHDGAVAAKKIDGHHNPLIIALEKEAPHDVAVYEVDDWCLEAGRRLYRRLLSRLQVCEETGHWPGVAPDPMPLPLPAWAPGCEEESEGF